MWKKRESFAFEKGRQNLSYVIKRFSKSFNAKRKNEKAKEKIAKIN